MSDATSPYRDAALDQVWRLIGQIDRNPHSSTRGSFSRTHWAWKFTDFPYPRFQEGVYALVRLYEVEDPRNPLYHSPAAEQWIAWGFEYWVSLQHPSGAYDEAYPYEQCLAATAFTSFYLGHAFLRWRDRLDVELQTRLVATFARAADWLCENDETHGLLSNHLAVAASALEIIGRVTGDPACAVRARFFLDRIFAHQSDEGWMQEYDGADIGYGTHAMFYLADYWRMTGCERTRAAARTLRGVPGLLRASRRDDRRRSTRAVTPNSISRRASRSWPRRRPAPRSPRDYDPPSPDRHVCGVWRMDDFNLMPMLNNLLFALDASSPHTGARTAALCAARHFNAGSRMRDSGSSTHLSTMPWSASAKAGRSRCSTRPPRA